MAAGPRYIASGRTAQKTPLPTARLLLRAICYGNHVTATESLPRTGLFTEPFPSNGCLGWLHNSGFQQTCHNSLL
jgi:hypothetical protein